MQADELEVGDVIFFMDSLGQPNHVAIYSGKREDTHFITHAVSEPYESLMTTRLRAYDLPYRVFRPANQALGIQAAHRMRVWVEHQVAFSHEKHSFSQDICDSREMCHPKTGGEAQCDFAQHFFRINFYRYIEYAAHPSMPYFPHQDRTQGMRCTEALTTAFNIETLLSINAVKSCSELNVPWITDQINLEQLPQILNTISQEIHISERYLHFLQSSHQASEYPLGNLPSNLICETGNFFPSIVAWRYNEYGTIENFIDNFKFPLPLDAKVTSTWALMVYFQRDPQQWIDCGNLVIHDRPFALEELEKNKEQWRNYVVNLFAQSIIKQELIRETLKQQSIRECNYGEELPKPEFDSIERRSLKINRSGSLDDLNQILKSGEDNLFEMTEENKYKNIIVYTSPQKPKTTTFSANSPPSANLKFRNISRVLNFDEDHSMFDKQDDSSEMQFEESKKANI